MQILVLDSPHCYLGRPTACVRFGLYVYYGLCARHENVKHARGSPQKTGLPASAITQGASESLLPPHPPKSDLATVASFGGYGKDRYQPIEKALFLLRNANLL